MLRGSWILSAQTWVRHPRTGNRAGRGTQVVRLSAEWELEPARDTRLSAVFVPKQPKVVKPHADGSTATAYHEKSCSIT